MIQNLLKYNSFVKDRIFEHLINVYNKKTQSKVSYCRALSELIEEIQIKMKAINHYDKDHPQHLQLRSYIHVYTAIKDEFRAQLLKVEQQTTQKQQKYIHILQSCKISHIENQKHVLEFTQKQLSSNASQIADIIRQIEKKQADIDKIKHQSFCHMLEILNEFDEDMIKQKFMVDQSEKNFKFLGSKRREMNDMLDEITAIQQQIKAKVKDIRKVQKERQTFLNKVCYQLNKAEQAKLQSLYAVCKNFQKKIQPLECKVSFEKFAFFKEMDSPYSQNRYFLQNYKKSIYLLLNPHPQNKLIIDHRETLTSKLSSSSEIKDNRKAQTYQYQALSFDFEVQGNKEDENQYNNYVQFINRIKLTVASICLSQEQQKIFYDYFKVCIRKKTLREIFLFYLYELTKAKSEILGLAVKQKDIFIHMIDIFLTQCLTYYDSQSAIKALMVIYHLKLPDFHQIYSLIRTHNIWKSFEFWETSFLQSVYEYFQMVVVYYHKLVQSQSEKNTNQNQNWFVNIFKAWPKLPQKKKMSPRDSLQQFYHEIVQNLGIVYLANMIMMRVPHPTIQKFKEYIYKAIMKLKWSVEYKDHLNSYFEAVCKKTEKKILILLRDDNLLDRIMSKLVGNKQQQQKEGVPLSKSISDWLDK